MTEAMRQKLNKLDSGHMFAMEANKAQIDAGMEIMKNTSLCSARSPSPDRFAA